MGIQLSKSVQKKTNYSLESAAEVREAKFSNIWLSGWLTNTQSNGLLVMALYILLYSDSPASNSFYYYYSNLAVYRKRCSN